MRPDRIKALLVDCDGVMHDNSVRLKMQAGDSARFFGTSEEVLIQRYFSGHQTIHDQDMQSHDNTARHFQLIGEEADKPVTLDQAETLAGSWTQGYQDYEENLAAFPDAEPFLRGATDSGLQLYLESGQTVENRDTLLEGMGFERYFADIFAANSIGRQKQYPGFYEHVLRSVPFLADELAIVGDQYNDDMSAKRFGITTILLQRPGTRPTPNEWAPNCVVSSLDEVLPVLG